MPYIEYEKDGVRYASVDGRMYDLKFYEKYGKHEQPFATFFVLYDSETDNFWERRKYKRTFVTAWNRCAEIAEYLFNRNKQIVLVRGKIAESEYNGRNYDTLECTWIEPLYELPTKNKRNTDDPVYKNHGL